MAQPSSAEIPSKIPVPTGNIPSNQLAAANSQSAPSTGGAAKGTTGGYIPGFVKV